MENERYDRQIRLFGAEGQQELLDAKVSVAGTGGIGSHVVQQIAYLGVGEITLIDMDTLANSNRNRLIGSYSLHPDGEPKTEILKALVENINPRITLNVVQESVISPKSQKAMQKSDFIFSCFDNDGPRAFVNEFVQAFEISCIDIASGIHLDSMDYGGRLIYIDGCGCLVCLNELDQDEIRKFYESQEQKEDSQKIYGIDKSVLHDSGPSVVSINGVMASLAVTEFMLSTTGIREPRRYLVYDGKSGGVRVNSTDPVEGCYFCNSVRGSKTISNFG